MAKYQQPRATALDKLELLPAVCSALFAGLTRLLSSPFNNGTRAPLLFKDVVYAVLRNQLGSLSLAQQHYIGVTTEAAYLAFAKEEGFKAETVELSDSKAFWIGEKSKEKVLVYLHGGGYVMPCGKVGGFRCVESLCGLVFCCIAVAMV